MGLGKSILFKIHPRKGLLLYKELKIISNNENLNLQKTIKCKQSIRSDVDDSRSPFAQFLVKLDENSYSECLNFEFDEKEKCKYMVRSAIEKLTIKFKFDFSTNFPDAFKCIDPL